MEKLWRNQLPIEQYQNFGRGDPDHAKFRPKGTDPHYKGCAFHISHAGAVQSVIVDLLVVVGIAALVSSSRV